MRLGTLEIMSMTYPTENPLECSVNVYVGDSNGMTLEKALEQIKSSLEGAGYQEKGKYTYKDILVTIDLIQEITTANFTVNGYDFRKCLSDGVICDLSHLNQKRVELVQKLDSMPNLEQIQSQMSDGMINAKEGNDMISRIEQIESEIAKIDEQYLRAKKKES